MKNKSLNSIQSDTQFPFCLLLASAAGSALADLSDSADLKPPEIEGE